MIARDVHMTRVRVLSRIMAIVGRWTDSFRICSPMYRKMQEASKIRFQCCQGILCNGEAMPDGDSLLNHSSNVSALVVLEGFTSPRSGLDFLLKYALGFRQRVAAALRPLYPHVAFSDVMLSSICSSADGCRSLLSFPCQDDKCRKADENRAQRRQMLEALPVVNHSVAIDFQVNLDASDNASQAAIMLNSSAFIADMERHFSARANASISLIYAMGPLPPVNLSSSSARVAVGSGAAVSRITALACLVVASGLFR